MRLRERISVPLLLITLILVAPAVYGLFALRDLQEVALQLRTRDAVGALVLGRLQTAVESAENSQRIHLALAAAPPSDPQREQAWDQLIASLGRAETELGRLTEGGYAEATAPAREALPQVVAAVREQQRLVEAGEVDAADQNDVQTVRPAFRTLSRALDPIGRAINATGASQVERAQEIAAGAATTTLLALAIGLGLALLIAGWLTRSLLRPIHELRRGMAVVAGGDFEPRVTIPADRTDELGDLARSFSRMAEQLAALDRLKAEFVSVASHELKTPLSVIRGYVSLLLDRVYGPMSEEQRKVLSSVGDQTDRLGRLVQQLLDISRFEAGGIRLEYQPLELRPFLNELATSFEALAFQNDIDFGLEASDDLPEELAGDPDRLNEVVGNLLSNAFKFTPRHGRIRLRAERAGPDAIAIEVADSGVGVPADELPRIFEKFYQVENRAQPRSVGSGLGLAIAREIVEAHGGTIGAESTLGEGTTFRVELPMQPLAAPTSRISTAAQS